MRILVVRGLRPRIGETSGHALVGACCLNGESTDAAETVYKLGRVVRVVAAVAHSLLGVASANSAHSA